MKFVPGSVISVIAALVSLNFYSCSTISTFSQYAYEQAVSLKVESLNLMDKAAEEFSANKDAVEDLKTKLLKSYEYSKGRPKNEISTKQWEILISPDRNLLGGFLKRWESSGTLSRAFIEDSKGLVSDAFDTIIGLESGKIKSSDINQ